MSGVHPLVREVRVGAASDRVAIVIRTGRVETFGEEPSSGTPA